MKKTYQGRCHCGAVRFEADIDLAADTGRCHCTLCISTRSWSATVRPDAFRLLAGEDQLSDYQFGRLGGRQSFCRQCGVRSFGRGRVEGIGGESVSVQLSALDDVTPDEWMATPGRPVELRSDPRWLAPTSIRPPLAAITSARSRAARPDLRTPAPASR